jgi:hypothetical protein
MVSKIIADQASSGGSGGHAGTFSLAKTGGMPMLSGTNKYSGDTTINPGTLPRPRSIVIEERRGQLRA